MSVSHQHIPGFGAVAWGAIAFLYVPIAAVLLFSFNESPLITVWEGFSTHWYVSALENDDLKRAVINSLVVGIGATVFSTLLALAAALALHGGKLPGKVAVTTSTLMTLPILIPEIVIAVATMAFFAMAGIELGIGNVLIAHVVFCTPFAYSPIRARIDTIPASMGEAAADLYADPWQAFRHVTLPLLMPGIWSGAMLAFITSLDDFIITQMVAPPGGMTLPVYIYSMVRRGITPEINAVSALLLLVSIVMVLASVATSRRGIIQKA